MAELRIKLEGEDAFLRRIPSRDVANLLLRLEIAVMRAASVVVRRPKTTTGRGDRAIENAARFRLSALEEGSVVPVLELPEPIEDPQALSVDVESLAEKAAIAVVEAIGACDGHPIISTALLELADAIQIGDRYEATFELRGLRGGQPPRTAKLDGLSRSRLRQSVERDRARVREDAVVGTLYEADFEKNSARLRGPLGEVVTVSFTEDLADEIQYALRGQATLEGEIAYDPSSFVARSVRLRTITRGRQLVLGIDAEAFWAERSFAELAAEHGGPIATRADELYDADASEEERDAFMAALADLG